MKETGVNWRVIKVVTSVSLGVAGILVIIGAYMTPNAFTTINGFYTLLIGAVFLWMALTLVFATRHHSSDYAVLQDDRPPSREETVRREAINITYALGSDVHPHVDNAPLGYSVHDTTRIGSEREENGR